MAHSYFSFSSFLFFIHPHLKHLEGKGDMQNRITKPCQIRKNKRADRLRDLLQLTPSDSILLDACARKPPNDG